MDDLIDEANAVLDNSLAEATDQNNFSIIDEAIQKLMNGDVGAHWVSSVIDAAMLLCLALASQELGRHRFSRQPTN